MAVIFFEGFERELSPQYWTPTDSSITSQPRTGTNGLDLSNSGAATCALRNFGTHSAKKVYLGFGVNYLSSNVDDAVGQLFLNVYNSSLAVNLTISVCSLATNTIGFVVRQSNATVATHTYTRPSTDYGSYRIWFEWLFLEFEFNLGTTPNTFAMRVNGNSVSNGTSNITNLSTVLGSISGFNFYNPTTDYSRQIDDLYISDDLTPAPTGYLGINTRVHSPAWAGGVAQHDPQWGERYYGGVSAPGSYAASTIFTDPDGPDGDVSCVVSSQFNQISVWQTNDIDTTNGSSANVGAVRINSSSRKVSLDAAYKYVFATSAGVKNEIGTKVSVTNDNYTQNNNQIITTNPSTGTNWTVNDINAGYFGVKSVDPAS